MQQFKCSAETVWRRVVQLKQATRLLRRRFFDELQLSTEALLLKVSHSNNSFLEFETFLVQREFACTGVSDLL